MKKNLLLGRLLYQVKRRDLSFHALKHELIFWNCDLTLATEVAFIQNRTRGIIVYRFTMDHFSGKLPWIVKKIKNNKIPILYIFLDI